MDSEGERCIMDTTEETITIPKFFVFSQQTLINELRAAISAHKFYTEVEGNISRHDTTLWEVLEKDLFNAVQDKV